MLVMGQTAIVTGVSGGIGIETARLLLKSGFNVIGLDKDLPVNGDGFPTGEHYHHFVTDITDEDSVRKACAEIREGRGELDAFAPPSHAILIAGGALLDEVQGDPLDVDLKVFRRSVDVNLSAQYICIKHFVRLFEAASMQTLEPATISDQSITMVSSINSVGDFGYPAYSAAKAGLAGLTKSLVVPLGRRGIRINSVALGTVRTDYVESLHENEPGHFSRREELTALGRISTIAEAAQVLFSMTQLSSVTGTIITADSGQAVPGNHHRLQKDRALWGFDQPHPGSASLPTGRARFIRGGRRWLWPSG
jgi:meso-butanediol dehydrogenase / (S,S)-butanediol dehydrogenase / diacetyl reductase